MSGNANKSLNERWVAAFNARDWASEAACRTADYKAHMSGSPAPLDATGWDAFMASFCAAFPDARIDIADTVGDSHTVASRWMLSGTHRGTFNGIPPTGRRVTIAGVDFSRIVDGKVAEHWAQFDLFTLMQQIDATPTAN